MLAALVAAVIAYALFDVLRKNLEVAPRAAEGLEGRLLSHMKNTTRFGGSAEQVGRDVWRAVRLDESRARSDRGEWTAEAEAASRSSPDALHVVVLPREGEDARAWAMPGVYWCAWSGAPLAFTGRDDLDARAEALVRERDVPAYVLAPETLVSERVVARLAEHVPVVRVAARDPAALAVALAERRDEETGFGWGRVHERRDGYFEYVVTAPSEAAHALAAIPLARSNAAALLYAADDGGVPAVTDRYLWAQRPDWFVTPAEGPFRHLWIVGDRTSYAAQARMDHALEKGSYDGFGPTALSPSESLAIALIAFGLAGLVFVLVHGRRSLPDVSPITRTAWAGVALLVPLLGVVLYLAAYRRPSRMSAHGPRFERPPSIRAAAALASGFGYGAPLMIAIAWLFAAFGLPQIFGPALDGAWFLAGSGMVWMMAVMWAGAILVSWLLVHLPMQRAMQPDAALGKLARKALGSTALGMSVVSLGMMTGAWWLQMDSLDMMPHEDELLWFGAMWLASIVGFLVAWPIHYPLVRAELKEGSA